jgi:hypothetical protein
LQKIIGGVKVKPLAELIKAVLEQPTDKHKQELSREICRAWDKSVLEYLLLRMEG